MDADPLGVVPGDLSAGRDGGLPIAELVGGIAVPIVANGNGHADRGGLRGGGGSEQGERCQQESTQADATHTTPRFRRPGGRHIDPKLLYFAAAVSAREVARALAAERGDPALVEEDVVDVEDAAVIEVEALGVGGVDDMRDSALVHEDVNNAGDAALVV